MQRDLWGKTKKEKASQLEKWLQRHDKESLPARLKRLHIVKEAISSPIGYILYSADSLFLFEDAKNCYISGQFAACILACQALLEHHIKSIYQIAGRDNIARMGFKKLIKQIIKDNIFPEYIISKLEELRTKRNPLVHTVDDFSMSYWYKASSVNNKPEELLEQDAKDAFLLTFEILNRRPFP